MSATDDEINALVTRAGVYKDSLTLNSSTPKRKIARRNQFMKCKLHFQVNKTSTQDSWLIENTNCSDCVRFEVRNALPNGLLPNKKEVIEYMITLNEDYIGQQNVNTNRLCSLDLMLHWLYSNVYPKNDKKVSKQISELFDNFKYIKNWSRKARSDAYWSKYSTFRQSLEELLDIKAIDPIRIAEFVKKFRIKMDSDFYADQKKIPREGFCSSQVDRKWEISQMRANKDRVHSQKYKFIRNQPEIDDSETGNDQDTDFNPSDDSDLNAKKSKFEYNFDNVNDEMPVRFRHVRESERSVRPEIYVLMNKLSSELHMSKNQIEGSILHVANLLFGRNWKSHTENDVSDRDTLPAMSSLRRTEPYMEAMALSSIVDEMMSDENNATITYSNDGSGMSGLGKYMVQSLSINGVQRTLPSFSILTETKENLKDLEIATLKILSAASGSKYEADDILKKIDFVMTDSTSHNIGVIELVSQELGVVQSPKTLLCNVHPLLLFQRLIKNLCLSIHNSIGKRKLKDCFLVDIEFHAESFIVKAIRCLCNFISKEYSEKPWNRQKHFDMFIKPKGKENMLFSLKDHRFTCLEDCCLSLIYHIDDIAEYLEKFSNVVNGISILDRSFVQMEILKPIFVTIALVGIHISRPFHVLLMDVNTNYSTLLDSFNLLYENLTTINPRNLLTTDQVFTFVSEEIFNRSKPQSCLLDALVSSIPEFQVEIVKLLGLLLKSFAEGFARQKGAIFGFSDNADEDTGTVLKISELDSESMNKLNKTAVHNIGEERNVGRFNYEVTIRGKQSIDVISKKLVLNKSFDLIQEMALNGEFKKYKKEVAIIKDIKLEWNKKMKVLEEKGYAAKEIANISKDAKKLEDLEFLKSQVIPGPFTNTDQVSNFMKSCDDEKVKTDRMYKEVRYARMTSVSQKETAPAFRLRRSGKYLSADEYAENLCQYLDDAKGVSTLTLSDLNNVLNGLKGDSEVEVSLEDSNKLSIGEHIASFWIVDSKSEWCLGVVEGYKGDEYVVSYLKRSDKVGCHWVYPDEADVHTTKLDQIIFRKIAVSYRCTSFIRCTIDSNTVELINDRYIKFSEEANNHVQSDK